MDNKMDDVLEINDEEQMETDAGLDLSTKNKEDHNKKDVEKPKIVEINKIISSNKVNEGASTSTQKFVDSGLGDGMNKMVIDSDLGNGLNHSVGTTTEGETIMEKDLKNLRNLIEAPSACQLLGLPETPGRKSFLERGKFFL